MEEGENLVPSKHGGSVQGVGDCGQVIKKKKKNLLQTEFHIQPSQGRFLLLLFSVYINCQNVLLEQ
jgi:hypothetical protein